MRGVRLCTLEEVFRKLGQSVDYNIHIKTPGQAGWVVARVDRGIERCCLAGQTDGRLPEWAKRLECTRVQQVWCATTFMSMILPRAESSWLPGWMRC